MYTSTGIITHKELPSGRVSGLFIVMSCLKLCCVCLGAGGWSQKLHNFTAILCGITRTPYRVFVVDYVTNGTAEKWQQMSTIEIVFFRREEMNRGSSLTISLLFVLFGVPSHRLPDKTILDCCPTDCRIKQF